MKLSTFVLLALCLATPAAARDVYMFPAPGPETETLVIEASADLVAIEPLIRDFQEIEPGVTIQYADSLTNDVFAAALEACRKETVFADLMITSSVDHIAKLTNDGCAQRHESAATEAIPDWANWRNEAFGFSFEPAVIVFNRALVPESDVPLTRNALVELLRTKPDIYNGRVGTYDITQSGIGYLFAFFDAEQSSVFGRLLEGFGRADAVLASTTGAILDQIESGEVLIGYNLLGSYAYGRLAAGAPIGIVLPHDFTIVLSRAALIPPHAENPRAGARFLDYLLSERGQNVAAQSSFFFAFDRPPPENVLAADESGGATFYRPIVLGPSLLVTLDQAKRARFLADWRDAMSLP
ncbi:ABC transporter substrate-binding protein [Pelagibacterium xiamenense]|uniref:ABC transporter substrate-binding protein n=1 Tax=Pelagibacterium xiamenense TaxID=2901140 RepID=UPI001E3ACC6C|nr:ABC transporter substrate-binding protein [Pelagibacterium xiamenense]MCD7059128.1 ABC transporter substrate-binding protein [Pelagibacterium xiamenense]